MSSQLKEWKGPAILLLSIGIANIGNFIYLVAINIVVYQMTGSAVAVAGLWIVAPLTNIITKFWTGSFIDYRSKRKIMLVTYWIRALLICIIPFAPNISVIYGVLVLLSVANSFFTPASTTYVTMIIPKEKRKRFNSIRSFTSSSAFIIGPAIGGTLILLTGIEITLWINALFFIAASIFLWFLPDTENIQKGTIPPLTIAQVIQDFTVVQEFMKKNSYVSFMYFGFIILMIFTFTMDAQEVVFTQKVIGLSEMDYSLLISITGIGSVVGGLILSIISTKVTIRFMISIGFMMSALGYVMYSFSWSFASIVAGFLVIGFFHVFLNAGITTFYQNNIPVEVMGRVTSIYQLIQSAIQVVFILMIGFIADIVSVRITIVTLAAMMSVASVILIFFIMQPNKQIYFKD